jgi:hypothetical protein
VGASLDWAETALLAKKVERMGRLGKDLIQGLTEAVAFAPGDNAGHGREGVMVLFRTIAFWKLWKFCRAELQRDVVWVGASAHFA